MLKKTIKYTDYDGNNRTEDFYFNLSKADLIKLQMSENGGLENVLTNLVNAGDSTGVYDKFVQIVESAYGEKSADGKHFRKSQEILENFKDTEAYSELIMELTTNVDSIIEFLTGVVPNELRDDVRKEMNKRLESNTNN